MSDAANLVHLDAVRARRAARDAERRASTAQPDNVDPPFGLPPLFEHMDLGFLCLVICCLHDCGHHRLALKLYEQAAEELDDGGFAA